MFFFCGANFACVRTKGNYWLPDVALVTRSLFFFAGQVQSGIVSVHVMFPTTRLPFDVMLAARYYLTRCYALTTRLLHRLAVLPLTARLGLGGLQSWGSWTSSSQ